MTAEAPSVLAVITARGGSKGVPGKNLRPLAGKPLMNWTVEAALAARCVTRTIVSTDAPDIAEAAVRAGAEAPFVRPADLASDTASSADVVAHALEQCPDYDYVVLLQPTSPLRTAGDIDAAFARMLAADGKACVSVSAVEESPWLMFRRDEDGRLSRLLPPWPGGMRRQDLPVTYVLNGAIYIVAVDLFRSCGELAPDGAIGHSLPPDHAVDIDTLEDFDRAEAIIAARELETAE